MVTRACKTCRRLAKGNMCPICKTSELTRNWKGILIVMDSTNSEVAKEAGITSPGKFAIRVK